MIALICGWGRLVWHQPHVTTFWTGNLVQAYNLRDSRTRRVYRKTTSSVHCPVYPEACIPACRRPVEPYYDQFYVQTLLYSVEISIVSAVIHRHQRRFGSLVLAVRALLQKLLMSDPAPDDMAFGSGTLSPDRTTGQAKNGGAFPANHATTTTASEVSRHAR